MNDRNSPDDPVTPEVLDPPAAAEAPPRAAGEDTQQVDVSQPTKLMRIAAMTRAMLDEARQATIDEAGRRRLVKIYENTIEELKEALSDELREEVDAIFLPLQAEAPTESELRLAQAQLVGWLEGLFHGIQASLWSQQVAAAAQLEQMRRKQALEAKAQEERAHRGLYL
ncbi:MAG TPA: DUF2587 domain-containing protein [Actinobacteria bacterium]|nr:DUF2587 domain-containing protein [Actinomycetota bacterium]